MGRPLGILQPDRWATKPGDRFGRLVVLGDAGVAPDRHRLVRCRCDCGGEKIATSHNLRNGVTRSCGCLQIEEARARRTTHGRTGSVEYRAWSGMLMRCSNPRRRTWPNYGGRGITVCARWRESFAAFLADMGRRPGPAFTLDRVNNEGDYEPGNCRWATWKQQANNRRPRRLRQAGA